MGLKIRYNFGKDNGSWWGMHDFPLDQIPQTCYNKCNALARAQCTRYEILCANCPPQVCYNKCIKIEGGNTMFDINAILTVIAQMMGTLNIPAALGNSFLDFAEVMLMIVLFPIHLIQGLFGG